MIFVILGTQQIPFPRLLKEIDKLIEGGVIREKVFAQIGYTEYEPKHFDCVDFLPAKDFEKCIEEARIVITHAGSGSLFHIIKSGKKGIAVPRLHRYGEMMDDHQLELAKKLSENGYILDGGQSLSDALKKAETFVPKAFDFEQHITDAIKAYIAATFS